MGQQLVGSILLSLNLGFLGWVLYHRCGLLSSITVKKGVSFNLRNMDENLHGRLYQTRCLTNLNTLINTYNKGPRIVEKGGVRVILRAFILYSDNEKDSGGEHVGNVEITELALQAMFGLLRTSPKESATQILQKWTIKHVAGYLDELNHGDLDMDEKVRNKLIVLVLKIIAQLSEHTTPEARGSNGWSNTLVTSVLHCMKARLRDQTEAESMQQWGICCLYNIQHNVNVSKESFSNCGGFNVVLDAVRRHRQALKLNQLAAVLMAECVFESVSKHATALKFLPEVFAEALSSGVMSALQDMGKEFPNNGDIHNCKRLMASEYSKPRPEVDVDRVEFVEMN